MDVVRPEDRPDFIGIVPNASSTRRGSAKENLGGLVEIGPVKDAVPVDARLRERGRHLVHPEIRPGAAPAIRAFLTATTATAPLKKDDLLVPILFTCVPADVVDARGGIVTNNLRIATVVDRHAIQIGPGREPASLAGPAAGKCLIERGGGGRTREKSEEDDC